MMSDKNAPNLDRLEMERVLGEQDTGCLCLCRDQEPYGLPVSYAYLDGAIVFHCARAGRKLDIIRDNPRVCFVVSRHPDPAKPHAAEGRCKYRFESVLCFGRARVVDDPGERLEILRRFKAHFYKRLGLGDSEDPVTEEAAQKVGCVVITVSEMTGRRKGG
jgi:nitroimidazol reductase NimA-like FMN-containing flavoprotein (pyridoxamine 5'-phosphate oxidase superfamily)